MALVIWRRSPVLTDLLICIVPYLAVVSPRREWYGAWAPPFRFGLVLLPLLALILVPLLDRRRRAGARGLVAALGFLALSLLLLWVVVPGWTYNLAVGTNHLIDHLSIRLAADVGRFLPSLVRPRMASWLVPVLGIGAVAFIYDGLFLGLTAGRGLRNAMLVSFGVFLPIAIVAVQRQDNHLLWFSLAAFMAARSLTLWRASRWVFPSP